MIGHGLDAVDPGAEIDAIEIELEDLILGQLDLEQQRDDGFFRFARQGAGVREEECACQLLRQGAAAFGPSAAQVAHQRPGHANRIDAGV
jgi:hypothetical protein